MGHYGFSWQETRPLSVELSVGIVRVRLGMMGFPHLLRLWRADGTGVEIWSKSHDIAERVELGVLQFALVHREKGDPTLSSARARKLSFIDANLPPSFHGRNRVAKLLISEAGSTADSGIILTGIDGSEIIIVSGAMPYSLAIRGIFSAPGIFEPEYDVECYQRTEIA